MTHIDIAISADNAEFPLKQLTGYLAHEIPDAFAADDEDDDGRPCRADGYGDENPAAFVTTFSINGDDYDERFVRTRQAHLSGLHYEAFDADDDLIGNGPLPIPVYIQVKAASINIVNVEDSP